MKAAAFAYARATSVAMRWNCCFAWRGRKVLSGGQSLMPAMNLRLVSPELIIDIGGLADCAGLPRGQVCSPSVR